MNEQKKVVKTVPRSMFIFALAVCGLLVVLSSCLFIKLNYQPSQPPAESKQATSTIAQDTVTTAENAHYSPSDPFVASINSDKFHTRKCYHAEKISEENKISFTLGDDARASGRTRCSVCF